MPTAGELPYGTGESDRLSLMDRAAVGQLPFEAVEGSPGQSSGRDFRDGRRPSGFDDVPPEVHAAYLAGALTGVIATWLTDDMPAPAGDTAPAFWWLFRS